LRNASKREPPIVEKILHGNHFGEVREQGYAVIGALIGTGVTQWTHLLGIINKAVKTLTPEPAVVRVGDCDTVLMRTRFLVP